MKSLNNTSITPLLKDEMKLISGGGIWEKFWRAVGRAVGGATIICVDESYDRDAQMDALSNYGAPY